MWKFIILALALYCLYKLISSDFLKKQKKSEAEDKEEMERKIKCGELVKDPECGAYVDVENSISVKDGDKINYFCSYECRDKFLKKLETANKSINEAKKDA